MSTYPYTWDAWWLTVDACDVRSNPFIADDMSWEGGCGDPPRGLKFTRARGSLQ